MHTGTTQVAPPGGSLAWARAFAVLYDPFLWVGERALCAAVAGGVITVGTAGLGR
jgi:hypothetical protein